jgi:hypothetical protein
MCFHCRHPNHLLLNKRVLPECGAGVATGCVDTSLFTINIWDIELRTLVEERLVLIFGLTAVRPPDWMR